MPPIVEEGCTEEMGGAGEGDFAMPTVVDEEGFKTELLGEDRELGDVDVDILEQSGKLFLIFNKSV